MKSRLLTLFLMTFLCLSIIGGCIAQPPFETSGDNSYEIRFLPFQSIKADRDFEFHFHVFNKSDGLPILNSSHGGVVCFFHLYDMVGDHIYVSPELTDNDNVFDWEIDIDAGNFSNSGMYSYFMQCNSSLYGGATGDDFEVTPNGEINTTGRSIFLSAGLISLSLMVLLFTFIFFKNEELWIKVFCFYCVWGLFLVIEYTAWVGFTNYLWTISFLALFFKWLFYIQMYATFPLVIGSFILYGYFMVWNKQMQRMMESGVPEDRAMAGSFRTRGSDSDG